MTSRANDRDSDTCRGDLVEKGGNVPPHESRVCQCYAPPCVNYLCAVCGVAVPWHKDLMIANPSIAGRFCNGCVDVEAAYHGLSVEEMHACRGRLRTKRIAQDRKYHGFSEEPQYPVDQTHMKTATPVPPARLTDPTTLKPYFEVDRIEHRSAHQGFRPERLVPSPPQPYLERGEACWCHRAKDCDGNHEFRNIVAVNLCGLCGETFEISRTDPHWSSGRGPICPKRTPKA